MHIFSVRIENNSVNFYKRSYEIKEGKLSINLLLFNYLRLILQLM